jgi:PAS domain-containing protein
MHVIFRHLYANSTSAILITTRSGTILDCNGAALQLLDGRQRSDLCNKQRKVFDLIEDGFVTSFRQCFRELSSLTAQIETQMAGCSRWNEHANAATRSIPVNCIMAV